MNDTPTAGSYLALRPRRALSPLFTVWTQPRQTADYVSTRSTLAAEVALAIGSGLSVSIYLSHRGTALDDVESALALTVIAIGGVYLGLMRLFIGSGVLLVAARLLGGKATLRSGRIALAWGAVPDVAGLAVHLGLFAYFGLDYFRSATTEGVQPVVLRIGSTVAWMSIVWTAVTVTNCLSQLLHLSGARAFAAFLLSSIAAYFVAGLVLFAVMAVTS